MQTAEIAELKRVFVMRGLKDTIANQIGRIKDKTDVYNLDIKDIDRIEEYAKNILIICEEFRKV